MRETSNYIVQYVGFKTNLNATDFIERWAPFANSFKKAGIKSIDLYQVQYNETLTFISRNVWDNQIYFQNFPSGIAGEASVGGISVIQFGGYWLQPDQLANQEKMKLVFLTNETETNNEAQIVRLSCSENMPYRQMLDILISDKNNFSNQINCNHLKQM